MKYINEVSWTDAIGKQLLEENVWKAKNELPDEKLDIEFETKQVVKKLTPPVQKLFYGDMRTFLRALSNKLGKTLPLGNSLLRDLQVFHPIMRTQSNSPDAIQRIAKKVFHAVEAKNIDKLMGEYRAYQNETEIKENWYIQESGNDSEGAPYVKWKPLDKYWARIFKITDELGNPKYRFLTHLIKCVIVLAHGNADVEQGFSVNALLVSSAKTSLSSASIVALRTMKDAKRTLGSGTVLNVPITRDMLRYVQNAHAHYRKERDEDVKRKEETAKAKAREEEKEKTEKLRDLKVREGELTSEIAAAQELLSEGNSKLAEAQKKKDATQIAVAQAMLSSATTKFSQTQTEMTGIITELLNLKRSAEVVSKTVEKKLKK